MTISAEQARAFYPSAEEVDRWLDGIFEESAARPFTAEPVSASPLLPATQLGYIHPQLMRFSSPGLPDFYGVWYPPVSGPKPLLTFLPGYGSELSLVPMVPAAQYAGLSLCPLGYWTPQGQPNERREEGEWPVLPDTARTGGQGGYRDWLLQAAMAVRWAWRQQDAVLPDRVTFFGTSQGGGAALLLGSLFAGRGTRCVMADEPFLTDYPTAAFRGAYHVLEKAYRVMPPEAFWHAVGLVDTTEHARRLNVPVMVTTGGADTVCPPETLELLWQRLPTTKLRLFLDGRGHGHNREFSALMLSFADLYA